MQTDCDSEADFKECINLAEVKIDSEAEFKECIKLAEVKIDSEADFKECIKVVEEKTDCEVDFKECFKLVEVKVTVESEPDFKECLTMSTSELKLVSEPDFKECSKSGELEKEFPYESPKSYSMSSLNLNTENISSLGELDEILDYEPLTPQPSKSNQECIQVVKQYGFDLANDDQYDWEERYRYEQWYVNDYLARREAFRKLHAPPKTFRERFRDGLRYAFLCITCVVGPLAQLDRSAKAWKQRRKDRKAMKHIQNINGHGFNFLGMALINQPAKPTETDALEEMAHDIEDLVSDKAKEDMTYANGDD